MKKKAKRAAKRKTPAGNHDQALREHLVYLLKGGGAHVHFTDAIEGFPEAKRGGFIEGLPHTAWQLARTAVGFVFIRRTPTSACGRSLVNLSARCRRSVIG